MTVEYIQEIRDFIVNNFLFGECGDLQDGSSFLENGILDSTGILELIEFLESEYNIAIDDDEMLPENLDSIKNVVCFVKNKVDVVKSNNGAH